jgi:hypothetical protein
MKTHGEVMYGSSLSRPRNSLEVSGQLHASATLTPGKAPTYPLDRKLREVSGQLHASATLIPGKGPPHTRWTGSCVDPQSRL